MAQNVFLNALGQKPSKKEKVEIPTIQTVFGVQKRPKSPFEKKKALSVFDNVFGSGIQSKARSDAAASMASESQPESEKRKTRYSGYGTVSYRE